MSADARGPFWRRRGAHLALVAGVAFAGTQVFEALPRDQELVFELPEGQTVSSFSAVWLDGDGTPLGGIRLEFPEGRRHRIRHGVRLANGDYEIRMEVERFGDGSPGARARSKTNLERRVTLRGGETPISLEQPNRRGIH